LLCWLVLVTRIFIRSLQLHFEVSFNILASAGTKEPERVTVN